MVRPLLLIAIIFSWIFPNICADSSSPLRISDVKFTKDGIKYRLPNNTKPEAYDVHIKTDIAENNFAFFGEVKIKVKVLQKSNSITLHQRKLDIELARLRGINGTKIELSEPLYDSVTELLTFTTVNYTFAMGETLFLTIKYEGVLRSDGGGFFRASYDSNGQETYD